MTRRARLVQCGVVVAAAVVGALAASRLDAPSAETLLRAPGVFSAAGPGVFVVVLAAGALLLSRAATPRGRPAWATTVLLLAYVFLSALLWHRRDPMGADAVATTAADGTLLPAQMGSDPVVLLTATVGFLCVLSALADLRRVARLAPVPVDEAASAALAWAAAAPAEAAAADAADIGGPWAPSMSSLDAELAEVPLMEEPTPPDLDAVPVAAAEPAAPAPPPARPATRLFE